MKRVRTKRFNLDVDVKYADGIDVGNKSQPRLYQAFGYVDSGIDFYTRIVKGDPDPYWRVIHTLTLTEHEVSGYLNLEVIRVGSQEDPGTSTGVLKVGLVRIPIPMSINTKIGGRFGLMRPVGSGFVPDGHVTVELKLGRCESFGY